MLKKINKNKSIIMSSIICFFSFFILLNNSYSMDNIIIDDNFTSYSLNPHLEILADEKGELTINDILTPEFSNKFKKTKQKSPNFGYTNTVYWTRFKLTDKRTVINEFLLETGYPLVDYIDLYISDKEETHYTPENWIVKKAGDRYPFSKRDIKHRNIIFKIPTNIGRNQIYYLRFKTSSSMQFPLTLWTQSALAMVDREEQFIYGIYYGLLILLVVYNLFIFISVREKMYLYYVFFIVFFILLQMGLNGYGYEYIWPFSPFIEDKVVTVFIGMVGIFLLKFTQVFLNIKLHTPKLNTTMNIYIILGIVMSIASCFLVYKIAIIFGFIYAILIPITATLAGVLVLKKESRNARYFLSAWSLCLIGMSIFSAKSAGLLPTTLLTHYSIQIGSAIQAILLSLGLADKINTMKNQLAHLNINLENKVKERTEELEAAMEELGATNDMLLKARDALWGEMQLAKKIQTILLPTEPTISGYEISTYMSPADEVGGDYYDIINAGDMDWIVIGDVSGHGVPAGLIMMMVQTAINVTLTHDPTLNPSTVLTIINKSITKNIKSLSEDKYMTITVLCAHKNGKFYFSGLHQDIMIYRYDKKNVEIVETSGMWLGIVDDIKEMLDDYALTLQPNDSLLLYTDGITEANSKKSIENPGDQKLDMFGTKRLKELFSTLGNSSTDDIKKGILNGLENYICKDDVTMVILKRLP